MRKKGFTLIELLAVIVILAIIALIATPLILKVIEKSKIAAFKDSIYGIYDSIDYYYASNLENYSSETKVFNFAVPDSIPFQYKGEKMISGTITVDEKGNKIVDKVTNGKYYASGTNNEIDVSKDLESLDTTAPIINEKEIVVTSTTNSLIVDLSADFAIDAESGIKGYTYVLLENEIELAKSDIVEEKTYTFSNIEVDNTKIYKIKIIVTNNSNKTSEVTKQFDFDEIISPTISYTNSPSTTQNGYLKSQMIKVTYNSSNISSPQYFIKTTRKGTSNLNVTSSCGTGTVPSECSTITSTTTLSANIWYKVNGDVSVSYETTANSTGTIYATTYDGINLSSIANGTIDMIDATSPTVTLNTPSINVVSGYNTDDYEIDVPFQASDSHSGIGQINCMYGTQPGPYDSTLTLSTSSESCTLKNLDKKTTYYYQVCATDKVKNATVCQTGSAATGPYSEGETCEIIGHDTGTLICAPSTYSSCISSTYGMSGKQYYYLIPVNAYNVAILLSDSSLTSRVYYYSSSYLVAATKNDAGEAINADLENIFKEVTSKSVCPTCTSSWYGISVSRCQSASNIWYSY